MGITAAQYTALSVFRKHGQLSNAQLAERSMVSPQSANEMVKTMEQRGWIARQSPSNHGRIIQIGLTAQGLELLKQCDTAVVEVEAAMLAEIGEDLQAPLYAQLKTMVRGLSVLTL
jgi:DNA-binding MarR family transcriptional regulator